MLYFVTVGNRTLEVDLTGSVPLVDGAEVRVEIVTVPGTAVRHLLVDGRSYALVAQSEKRQGRWRIELAGERFTVDAVDERTRAIREMAGGEAEEAPKTVVAPMPGLVVKIEVEVGQQVRAGQGVVIVEAMKMENELRSPADGVVARIDAQLGQTVEKGATLVVLE